MVSAISSLGSTLATTLLCALLFVDEAGMPLPLAPNEVLLLVAGLLIGTGALNAVVFLPLALLVMAGGMLSGFGWAHLLGSRRLRALARRVHAERTYARAEHRLRRASPLHIGIARLIPGVRTYATLVAGAAEVDLRRFLSGAVPALALWLVTLTAVGAVVGAPAERVAGEVDGLVVSGGLLVALAAGSFLAVSRMPRDRSDDHPLARLPHAVRLLLAAAVDLGIIASLIAGVERLVARFVNPGHPFGEVNDVLAVATVAVVGYVLATRRLGGATIGEGLLDADYRAAARRAADVRHGRPGGRRGSRARAGR